MYEFYMDGVRLPVTPSALTIKISNQNKTCLLYTSDAADD